MQLVIRTPDEIDKSIETIKKSAERAVSWFRSCEGTPLDVLRRMKFELSGRHPTDDRALNLIEQVNQTWTHLAALEAARELLRLHPNEIFYLAPGAHAALKFDIVSGTGQICAETFAAVRPTNNRKLEKDLAKLERYPEIPHRYIFFMSPNIPPGRCDGSERAGIKIWSVSLT